MYLDEVFNNFLGTLRPLPDLRQNNPSLEHGKFVTDKSKYYAGKSMLISTDNSIDGSGKHTEIKVNVPSQCLMNRTSAPDLESIVEGFNIGERVIEGNTNQCGITQEQRAALQAALTQYDELNSQYAAALEKYSKFKQNLSYSKYLNKFVKYITTSSPPVTEVYYINSFGFKYKVPRNTSGTSVLPERVVTVGAVSFDPNNLNNIPTISDVDLTTAFPPQPKFFTSAYVIKAGQDLTLAGKIVKYRDDANTVYLWVDVEGVAHKFTPDILSDAQNNASSTCQLKLSSTRSFNNKAAFDVAIGQSGTGPTATTDLVGSDITDSAYMCSDLPSDIIAKKIQVDAQEQVIKDTLTTVYANLPNCLQSSSPSTTTTTTTTINQNVVQNPDGTHSSNPSTSTTNQDEAQRSAIRGIMPTYDGKVKDTFKNVKSKLAYYLLWLAFMIFIVVVTFRNMADSEGPDSGSFQASAAILIVLVIYLVNFLSNMRLGPNQALSEFFGALPEKLSAMMNFAFT
jgi:hypothetical protein